MGGACAGHAAPVHGFLAQRLARQPGEGGGFHGLGVDAELARLAVQNEWEGLVIYGSVRQVDDLEELDIGIQAIAAIPVGASGEGIGESDVRVNFGGVTFFSGDHLYADNTGIILSEDPLDIE